MKILVLCGDYWHSAEVVKTGLDFLRRLPGCEIKMDFLCDAKDILTFEMMRKYQVIINAKGNQKTEANSSPWFERGVTEAGPAEFRRYVTQGGGFLVLHAGNSFSRNECGEYTDFTGSIFLRHPPRCEVSFRVTAEHPVTKGVKEFCVRDEHYVLEMTDESAVCILESSSAVEKKQIGGYVRCLGAGRLCALTMGHTASVYENPEVRKLIKNAVCWCAAESDAC